MGDGGWTRVRIALGLAGCSSAPSKFEHLPLENVVDCGGSNNPRLQCRIAESPRLQSVDKPSESDAAGPLPPPLSPSSKRGLFRHGPRISRGTCPICLESMKTGNGHAIFTAECSHAFHFRCIASNVRHGNLICAVCRATWKEVPWQAPPNQKHETKPQESGEPSGQSSNPRPQMTARQQEALRNAEEEQRRMDPVLRILDESIASIRGNHQMDFPEPATYDDDEPLRTGFNEHDAEINQREGTSYCIQENNKARNMEIALHPEAEAVAAANTCNFTVLVHVKAPRSTDSAPNTNACFNHSPLNIGRRVPVDLVTVLDVSGSMSGTKLALLKRAMTFVISSLSAADRLSVVVFSSTARRVFPLKSMSPEGQRSARRVIERLVCMGGTSIGEGLKKGAKVLHDRRRKNPVASIMLLSDGQDTFCMTPRRVLDSSAAMEERHASPPRPDYSGHVPIHAFGFGVDHDATTMHKISEDSGGTFSFIQSESLVQDAFAQCIGGLLSVVVQDVKLTISPHADGVQLKTIHVGGYRMDMADDGSRGTVQLGDLYADEDRHILVDLKIPSTKDFRTNVVAVNLCYKDPISQQEVRTDHTILSISRPDAVLNQTNSQNAEVERQKNRLKTAQAIAQARCLADRSKLAEAQQVLARAKVALQSSLLTRTGDKLSRALESELTEIESRMTNRHIYERSGRAYALSAQNSHFRQRATTRGESMDSFSREYQTPSMVNMVTLSQSLSSSSAINNTDNSSTSSDSAWKVAEKLAKVAVLRKSLTKVSDLHGFEKAGF